LVRRSLENAPVRYNPHKAAPGAFHPPRAGGYCTLTSDDESAMNRPEYATLTTTAGGGGSGRCVVVSGFLAARHSYGSPYHLARAGRVSFITANIHPIV
jgi:hypothetical protein